MKIVSIYKIIKIKCVNYLRILLKPRNSKIHTDYLNTVEFPLIMDHDYENVQVHLFDRNNKLIVLFLHSQYFHKHPKTMLAKIVNKVK